MMQVSTIGLNIAKSCFAAQGYDAEGRSYGGRLTV
jgi:hypothetical protein